MQSDKAFLLNCAVQSYAWGKVGSNSAVAQLSESGNPSFQLKEEDPYAELWMGTHPKGPSVISHSGEALSQWVEKNPDAVGEKVSQAFPTPGQLPYLFKVLSVNKALSIQAHPNKSLAEKLHAERPDKYPDANHKPEMAIALTEFEGLCGFRPKQEIVGFLQDVPEFKAVVGEAVADDFINATDEAKSTEALKECFSALMNCDSDTIEAQLNQLVQRLQAMENAGESTADSLGDLILRLNSQFPGDGGCFCAYFLNRMLLNPGEAMFLEANLPHAYLAGDCMECMACSDNVVRAGLTPKFKDVPTLCSMLNYSCKPATENLFQPTSHPTDKHVTVFNPPIPDFAVARIQLEANSEEEEYTLEALDSASIILVVEGEVKSPSHGLHLKRGSVLFVTASESVQLQKTSNHKLLMFRAYCHI